MKVRQQLQEKGLVPDDWGGETIFVDCSALTKQGVEVKATTRAQTAEFIRNEMKRYSDIVAFSGAKVD